MKSNTKPKVCLYSQSYNQVDILREKYQHASKVLRVIQRPSVYISSFCISFFAFNFFLKLAAVPQNILFVILIIGLVALAVALIIGHIEKKLFKQYLSALSEENEKRINELRHPTESFEEKGVSDEV